MWLEWMNEWMKGLSVTELCYEWMSEWSINCICTRVARLFIVWLTLLLAPATCYKKLHIFHNLSFEKQHWNINVQSISFYIKTSSMVSMTAKESQEPLLIVYLGRQEFSLPLAASVTAYARKLNFIFELVSRKEGKKLH